MFYFGFGFSVLYWILFFCLEIDISDSFELEWVMIHETFVAMLLIVKYLQLLINVHQFVLNSHKHGKKKSEYRFRL